MTDLEEFHGCGATFLIPFLILCRYFEDPSLNEDITTAQNNNKHIVAACFEPNLAKEFSDVVWVDLNRRSGNGVSHTFDPTQLSSLITECQTLLTVQETSYHCSRRCRSL